MGSFFLIRSLKPAAFLMFLFFASAGVHGIPDYKGYVTDYAGIITPQDRAVIEAVVKEIKNKSGAEIAVLTVDTIEPYGTIEEYSLAAAEKWGVGGKELENGLLIVLSMKERYVRLETGYGLEGAIPDGLAGSIIDRYMIPYFINDNFSEGLKNGVLAAGSVIADEYDFVIEGSEYRRGETSFQTESTGQQPVALPLFELIFILFFLLGGGRFFLPLLLLSGMRGRRTYRGGFGSGFGRTGGFSGGFGGFGGGSFGGGGASRSF